MNPCRGEVWQVRFDPKIGAEIEKSRPAVVVNVDSLGKLPLRIVVPITGWLHKYGGSPWLVYLWPTHKNGLTKDSAADSFQAKSVSLERFDTKLGVVEKDEMADIAAAIALCVGYDPE